MFKSLFLPQNSNAFAWVNLLLILALLYFKILNPLGVLFVYFLESIIIGVFNIIKMRYCQKYQGQPIGTFIAQSLFFVFHYGFFIAIQSVFLFVILSMADVPNIKEPFHILDNYWEILNSEGVFNALIVLTIGQLIKFILDFMLPQKYRLFTIEEVMFKPYLRIFIQQFVVILGMFFIIFTEASIFAALLLIIFRFLIDLLFSAIKTNSLVLEKIVEKLYDGKTPKNEIKKQLLLWSE